MVKDSVTRFQHQAESCLHCFQRLRIVYMEMNRRVDVDVNHGHRTVRNSSLLLPDSHPFAAEALTAHRYTPVRWGAVNVIPATPRKSVPSAGMGIMAPPRITDTPVIGSRLPASENNDVTIAPGATVCA